MPTPGPLPPPPEGFRDLELPVIEFARSKKWYRSHLVERAPVFYGKKAQFRFDDPAQEYGVLYLAEDPFGAFVETFGQFVSTVALPRQITTEQLLARALSELVPDRSIQLADLTGSGLARMGADSRLFAGNYGESQAWSRALFLHPSRVDGLFYPTRHDPKRKAAAIFAESIRWSDLSRKPWLALGLTLRSVLSEYRFALIESQFVQLPTRKRPAQEELF